MAGIHGRFSAGLTAEEIKSLRYTDPNEERYGVAERVREIVSRLLSASDGSNLASLMVVADAGDHFTATTLEGVLAELAVAGVTWKPSVAVRRLQGSKTIAEIDSLSTGATAGDAYIAGDAGTPAQGSSDALVLGDIAEWDGTQWKKIVAAVDDYVPAGTVCVVGPGTLVAPFTDVTDRNKVVTFDGNDNNGTLATPTKGEARFCAGQGSYLENRGFVYDTSPAGWNDIAGPTLYATATPAAVGTAAVGSSARLAREDHVHAHGDQGAVTGSLHDADQVDYERASGSRTKIQAASASVEAALNDLDDATCLDLGAFFDAAGSRVTNPGTTTEEAFPYEIDLPGDALVEGALVEWEATVQIVGANTGHTAKVRARVGGLAGVLLGATDDFDPVDAPGPGTGDLARLSGTFRVRTAGASGAIDGHTRCVKKLNGSASEVLQPPFAAYSADLSGSTVTLSITVEFSGNSASNIADLIDFHASIRETVVA